MLRDKKPLWAECGQGTAGRGQPLPPAQGMLLSPEVEEGACGTLGWVLMFGKVEIPEVSFAACDPLDTSEIRGYVPIIACPCTKQGETRVLGKAKVLLAGCCTGMQPNPKSSM